MAGDQAELLFELVWHLVLTGLPGAAAACLAARKGVESVAVLLAIALAASGLVAAVAFWSYYADPDAGTVAAWVAAAGSLVLIARALYRSRIEAALLRALAVPLVLWALASVFILFLGFLHGGVESPLATASIRFSHQLPSDNYIPLFFAEWFFSHGHAGEPPTFPGEWLSSDRPPLQIGYVLSQRAFAWDSAGVHYQVLGVVLQQLWIVGLWALLVAAKVGRTTRVAVAVAALVSHVAIVNGFFVWPKLLPAALLLAVSALLLTPLWPRIRDDVRAAPLIGALLALALLGHGASVFGAVPLLAVAARRGLPSGRWLAVAAAVGALIYAPWIAYQDAGDPPGNRLTKWMLAGAVEVDDRGTLEAIADGYGEAGVTGTLENKAENLLAIVGETAGPRAGDALDSLFSGELGAAVRDLRRITFLHLLPSLGLLLIAPLVIGLRRNRAGPDSPERRLALSSFAVVGIGCVVWALLMFGSPPSRTDIHVGSLLIPLLAVCGAVVGLRAILPRFANYLIGANVLLTLALYVPSLDPQLPNDYSVAAMIIAIAGLGAFARVAFRA